MQRQNRISSGWSQEMEGLFIADGGRAWQTQRKKSQGTR